MPLKIGELAKRSGCQVVTIRYYEKEGLLPPPERTDSNYRLYGDDDVERLHFIRRCRLHGMNLAEIRKLLSFKDHPSVSCAWVNELVDRHIADVEQQIASLQHLKKHLEALRRTCAGDHIQGCGIIDSLNHGNPCACCEEAHCALTEYPAAQAKSPAPHSGDHAE